MARAFTVFIDESVAEGPLPKPLTLSPTTLLNSINSSPEAGPSSLSAAEKENLHPLTGSRISSVNVQGSKRKSSVLVTKLHNPPQAKKLKKEDSSEAPAKKRRATSSESREPNSKARKTKPTRHQRKAPKLPNVEEEDKDKDERIAQGLSQSEINSRCYDLTVTPLANVSEAYGQPASPSKEGILSKSVSKAGSVEPELRDYIASPADAITPSPSIQAPTRDRSLPPPVLSTPERKRIYTSFTFSSPIKPSSVRYNPSASLTLSDTD